MNKIHEYFTGERNESLIFMAIGAIAILCSIYFWLVINVRFYNGIAWPLFFIALIQLTVGGLIYLRSPSDEKRVTNFYNSSPKNITHIEIPRMEKVMRNFIVYRYVEIGLIVISIVLFFMSGAGGFWRGISIGTLIQASLMLMADGFAEQRGKVYLAFLNAIGN